MASAKFMYEVPYIDRKKVDIFYLMRNFGAVAPPKKKGIFVIVLLLLLVLLLPLTLLTHHDPYRVPVQ